MSLLDELKKQAAAKQSQEQINKQRQAELEARSRNEVLPKLAQIYTYLKELLKQVEILQADVRVDYDLKGCGKLRGLRQDGYELRTDSRDNMTHLTLGYYCVGDDEIRFELETRQQVEQQKDYFKQHDLVYTSRDYRDERHNITHAMFSFEPRIPVVFDFHLSEDQATIMLTVHNYAGLQTHRYQLEPARIDEGFLDELGKYILRRENSFLKLDIPDDFRENLRQRLAGDEKKKHKKLTSTKSNVTYLDIKRKEKQGQPIGIAPAPMNRPQQPAPAMAPVNVQTLATPDNIPRDPAKYSRFANLPSPIKELKRSELDKAYYVERLETLRNFPDKLFQNAAQFLSSFNRSAIKPNKRLELVSAVIGQVYPVLAEAIGKHRQQHSLPENHARREVLLSATSMIEQMAIAYKHVFTTDINEDIVKNHDRMAMCSFRILEMIRIEQRLRALRYQKLPASTWVDCNKVFFYILEYADIDKEFKLLGSASRWVKDKPLTRYNLPSCSIKKLYFSIQLFGVLDITTWPVGLFQVSDQYLELMDDGLRLIHDQGQELASGWLISAFNHNGPASFKRLEAMRRPSVIIDYSPLYNYLVTEYDALTHKRLLGEYDESSLSEPLQSIHKYDRFPVLESILLSLRERERNQKRHAAISRETFCIYFGFDESYSLLSDKGQADEKEPCETRDFADALAAKSSIVLDDRHPNMHAWEMVNFSAGGLLVNTQESDFTRQIEIGQLVAFAPEKQQQDPLLGCVTRVQRNSYQNVEIAIFRLSNYAEAAQAVQSGKVGSNELPVILMLDMDEKWKILVPNQYGLVSGTPLHIIYANGKKVPARLGDGWLIKNTFTIYELSSPMLN